MTANINELTQKKNRSGVLRNSIYLTTTFYPAALSLFASLILPKFGGKEN